MKLMKKIIIITTGLSAVFLCVTSYKQYQEIQRYIQLSNQQQLTISNLENDNRSLKETLENERIENDDVIKILSTEIDNLNMEIHRLEDDVKNLKEYYNCNQNTIIFDASNLRILSGIEVYQMKEILKGTALYDYAEAYVIAEKSYNINAIALAAITAHESSWGESDRAKRTNNLTGYAVYTEASAGQSFSSPAMSIVKTAELLDKDYLRSSGKWYNGLSLENVNTSYCYGSDNKPDYDWSKSITNIGKSLVAKIN